MINDINKKCIASQCSAGVSPVSSIPHTRDEHDTLKDKNSRDDCSTFSAFRPLDYGIPVDITRRNLPHWKQTGKTYFVTFRLTDSIPSEELRKWKRQREEWVQKHPQPYSESAWNEYNWLFSDKINTYTDYDISDIMRSVKSYTAHEINKLLRLSGQVWQDESFDHIIRSSCQKNRIEQYIWDNPKNAGLAHGFKCSKKCSTGVSPVSSINSRDDCSTLEEKI